MSDNTCITRLDISVYKVEVTAEDLNVVLLYDVGELIQWLGHLDPKLLRLGGSTIAQLSFDERMVTGRPSSFGLNTLRYEA